MMELDFGEFEGMESSRRAEEYPDLCEVWLKTPSSVTMPGGEGLKEVQMRTLKAVRRIIGLHPPGGSPP